MNGPATRTTGRFRAAAAVLAVLTALGLALLASHSGPPLASPAGPRSTVETIRPVPTQTTPILYEPADNRPLPRIVSSLAWLYLLIAAAVVFLGLAAIPLMLPARPRLWRRFRPGFRPPPGPPPVSDRPPVEWALAGAVDAALARLESGPVDDAIVACWLGLEAAAAKAGTQRLPSQTSAELTERVLAEHRVTPQTLRRLAELYREARFSRHTLGEDARADARALFERVRDELLVSR